MPHRARSAARSGSGADYAALTRSRTTRGFVRSRAAIRRMKIAVDANTTTSPTR